MSEPQHPDILIRLMHFCASPDMFVREEISGGYVRDMLRDARDEIDRLRGYRDEAESDAAVARMLVDRLRLTDEERAEIEALADEMKTLEMCYGEDSLCQRQSDRYGAYARLLTAMLKRTE